VDSSVRLLDRAGCLRESRVCVRAYKSYRADHDHENDGQHHSVLCDVLTLFLQEQFENGGEHFGHRLFRILFRIEAVYGARLTYRPQTQRTVENRDRPVKRKGDTGIARCTKPEGSGRSLVGALDRAFGRADQNLRGNEGG